MHGTGCSIRRAVGYISQGIPNHHLHRTRCGDHGSPSSWLKVTGHLCSVTYPEATNRFFENTPLILGKQPGVCPATALQVTFAGDPVKPMESGKPRSRHLINRLVRKCVTLTFAAPLYKQAVPGRANSSRHLGLSLRLPCRPRRVLDAN
jgi:hypothetical protein